MVSCPCPACASRDRLECDRSSGKVDEFTYGVAADYLPPCAVSVFKRHMLESMLDQHAEVLVRCDGAACDVPGHLRAPGLVLRLGRNLNPPIVDMECRDANWSATLRFAGKYHKCTVPWSAVEAIGTPDGPSRQWPKIAHVGGVPNMDENPEPEKPVRRLKLVD